MKFRLLEDKEFMDFVKTSEQNNFFQTTYMRDKFKMDGLESFIVGVECDGKIVCAGLLTDTGYRFLGKRVFEAYRGVIMDYNNLDLVKFFTNEVKKFLKSKNCYRLIINPYIMNVSRDRDGNIIEGIDNRKIKDMLYSLGYRENPNPSQVKWCYSLDLSPDANLLFKEFKGNTRNCINKTMKKYKLRIRDVDKEHLDEFKKITMEASSKHHFNDKDLTYYERMYDAFKDKVTFKIVELDLDIYIDTLLEEKKNLEERLSKLVDTVNNKKREEALKDIEFNKNRLDKAYKLKEEEGSVIPLSAAMFMLYGDEIIYLFSGSYDKYMEYYGQYLLQWDIIQYGCKNGYKKYNFYGIEDPTDPTIKDRGVHEFKKGFNGDVDEKLGSFIIGISFLDKLHAFLSKVKGCFRK